jgi:hypothetical protein
MRLSKRQLAEKLGCSERSLTIWQARGLPVLEHGGRGRPSTYDLGAVVAWIKKTGAGLMRNTFRHPSIDIARLELELGRADPSAKASAEETFTYLCERGVVPLAAALYLRTERIDTALETAGEVFFVLWNVLVDRFDVSDFARASEKFTSPLLDVRDPDRQRLVESVYQAAALQRAKQSPELDLDSPPVQTSAPPAAGIGTSPKNGSPCD